MGNVGVAIHGTHDSAPFYNPAGLNDIEDARFQFFSITGGVSTDSFGLVGDTIDLIDDLDAQTTDAGKVSVLDQFIQARTGEFHHVRVSLDLFNYVRKNFAIGLTLDERLDMSFRDQSVPHFDVRNLGDAMVFLGASTSFLDRLIQVGVTLRPVVRFAIDEADQTVTYADVVAENADGDPVIKDQFENMKERRFGMGVDLGFKSDLGFKAFKEKDWYKFLNPAIGLTWQDIGSPSFGVAPGNEQSVSLGFAVHPNVGKFKNTFGLDFRSLNQEKAFLSKMHLGAETVFDWVVDVGLRVGLSQGYFTAGTTFDFKVVRLDAAYYNEEVGAVTRQGANQRLIATLSFNI